MIRIDCVIQEMPWRRLGEKISWKLWKSCGNHKAPWRLHQVEFVDSDTTFKFHCAHIYFFSPTCNLTCLFNQSRYARPAGWLHVSSYTATSHSGAPRGVRINWRRQWRTASLLQRRRSSNLWLFLLCQLEGELLVTMFSNTYMKDSRKPLKVCCGFSLIRVLFNMTNQKSINLEKLLPRFCSSSTTAENIF